MVRRLLRTLRHLGTAVLLLVGMLCAGEVALRVARVQGASFAQTIVLPSRHCYLEMQPHLVIESEGQRFATSSLGTRGPEPTLPKPTGQLRVLVLGDDRTLALHLPREATYCSQLEASLRTQLDRPVEVINAGVPGGCPLTAALQFRHRLHGLQPDVVVLALDVSDVADDLHVRPQLLVDSAGRPVACPHPATRARPRTFTSELAMVDLAGRLTTQRWMSATSPVRSDLLCRQRQTEWAADPTAWAIPLANMLRPILTLRDEVLATGAAFQLTALPTPESLQPGGANPWHVVGQFALHEGVEWFDPVQGLARQSQQGDLFETTAEPESGCGPAARLTATAHRQLAEALRLHLTRQ